MALIGNYSVLSKHPGRDLGGGAIGLGMNRGDDNKSSSARAMFTAPGYEPKSGVPDGYRPGSAWVIPIKGGALRASNNVAGAGAFASAGTMGVNGAATLAGAGDLSGVGALIVSLVSSLTGSGTISNAAAQAFLSLAATLAGSGNVAGACSALASASAILAGTGTATATIRATGAMASSIAATGEVLTGAGIAASVWSTVLEAGLDATDVMRLLLAVAAGQTTIDGSTVAFRDQADTKDRVTATMTGSERTTVALDAA